MYLHRNSAGAAPRIARSYDTKFTVTPAYRASLPDMMETAEAIPGAHVPIQQVGISNFKLPLNYRTKAGKILTLETSVTGTVSLQAELKGINMSRIMRAFYDHKDEVTTGEWMGKILKAYLRKVESKAARLKIRFSYPMTQTSLRSGLDHMRRDVEARKIPADELRGNTITLSNFGMIGGRYSAPVVLPPTVAIVGAGRIFQGVVAANGAPAVHRLLPLSVTFDHRAVTGGEAGRFLAAVVADLGKAD